MPSRADTNAATDRKPYKKPILTGYGQLKDLTAGGSGNASEGSQGQRPRP